MDVAIEPYGAVRFKAAQEPNPATRKARTPVAAASGGGRGSRMWKRVPNRRRPSAVLKLAAVLLTACLSATWIIAASIAFLHPSLPDPTAVLLGDRAGAPPGPARRSFFGESGGFRDSFRSLGRRAARLEKSAEESVKSIGRAALRWEDKAGGEAAATLGRMKRRDMGLAQIGGVEGGRLAAASLHRDGRVPAREMDMATPLLIFTCVRADYLQRTLNTVFRHHPVNKKIGGNYSGEIVGAPVLVSQDGDDQSVKAVISEFRDKFAAIGVPVLRLEHRKQKRGHLRGNDAYKALAVHYGWALKRTFSGESYEGQKGLALLPPPRRVIVLEEDIDVAPDFFSYMAATAPLLDSDESLLAVSAWSDNGKVGMVGDPKRLVRSDFFPGLGWMIPRRVWDEIGGKWPEGWWDDWIREPDIRKGRHTIRPEVSKTLHFGSQGGASNNQFGSHLQQIQLNDQDIRWFEEDLSYLDKDAFRESYYRRVVNANVTDSKNALESVIASDVRIEYSRWRDFLRLAKKFDLMGEEKAGVPRSGFENIVDFRPSRKGTSGKYLIFISPPLEELQKNLEEGRNTDMLKFSQLIRQDPKKR